MHRLSTRSSQARAGWPNSAPRYLDVDDDQAGALGPNQVDQTRDVHAFGLLSVVALPPLAHLGGPLPSVSIGAPRQDQPRPSGQTAPTITRARPP